MYAGADVFSKGKTLKLNNTIFCNPEITTDVLKVV